ncbi:MAG TPA: DNA repair protein RecN [Flavobacterium sp.]|jgi:DNA repair protein RecN (Recombination protein N)
MITSLSIENFALIEKLSVEFESGFSIITGETGAGKSILLGALGLALGKRADLTSLKNKEEKCIIEAVFNISAYSLKFFFEENDLDYEEETIIRREILPSGKSRAFVNDSPVNLQELQELGNLLIDIHSQHETRELSEEDFQFRILDSLAGNTVLLADYTSHLKIYREHVSRLDGLRRTLQDSVKEQDYNSYLFDELAAAALQPDEQSELEMQLDALSNVELIRENLVKAITVANADQVGILPSIKDLRQSLQKISVFSEKYNELFERSSAVLIELNDIVHELEQSAEKVESDPVTLEKIQQRLQLIYSLQKKHSVSSVEELIAVREDLDQKVGTVAGLEDKIRATEAKINETAQVLDEIARKIHDSRAEAAPVLAGQLAQILKSLGMPDARFLININTSTQYFKNGKDAIDFLFSANKGGAFGSLKKIASGGEMSRIMLAVKSILSHYSKLPTIIFDEIDTGVSGEIANKMGDIMKDMSRQMQVFAITHLPQIAAKGNRHFKVSKYVQESTTVSTLQLLSKEERVTEIAQMLSGSAVSESAINHAKALLD